MNFIFLLQYIRTKIENFLKILMNTYFYSLYHQIIDLSSLSIKYLFTLKKYNYKTEEGLLSYF